MQQGVDARTTRRGISLCLQWAQGVCQIANNTILGGSVAELLACWTQAQGPGFKSQPRCCRVTVLGKQNCSHPTCLCSPSRKIGSSPLKGCGGNCRPGGKWWQPTVGFMLTSRHLQADCQEPWSAPEPYARQSSMGYLYLFYSRHSVCQAHSVVE